MNFAVIGYPLSHSFSPAFFAKKFAEWHLPFTYSALPVASLEELPDLVKKHDLQGFNVTLPHKTTIIPYLQSLSPEAEALGAVNCVKVTPEGWIGFNTDVTGIEASLQFLFPDGKILPALVLGDGGSARAVCFALSRAGVPFLSLSRHPLPHQRYWHEANADVLNAFPFLIQTTPLGMFPHIDNMPPLNLNLLPGNAVAFDLIYNPPETRFLQMAKKFGARTLNGQLMLETQALASWELWKNQPHF